MASISMDAQATSRLLSASISSLSSSRQQASQIAKAYRQAAQLFLTRRLPEALSTIEPVITPVPADQADGEQDGQQPLPAPVAAASRGTRVKVWSFYLTFLNAVVELGPEEGKHAFGSARWKQLVAKCREGTVWAEVVRDGYGGNEGDVDPEVVINLATLLLTHAPSQKLTQQRLETYLSATAHPTFDFSAHMQSPIYSPTRQKYSTSGTATPRDLHTRLKLLELYTLHVLPRNGEWDYAREFISMSEVLDDERKEAFLLALHGLREEQENAAIREAELRRQQQEQLEQRQREAEAQRQEQLRADEERRKRETEASRTKRSPDGYQDAPKPTPSTVNRQRTVPSSVSRPQKPPPKKIISPPPNFYERASGVMTAMQAALLNTAQSLRNNPLYLLRFLLFVFAFALAFGRRDIRERLRRLLATAWDKVRRTLGMGVKVSYI